MQQTDNCAKYRNMATDRRSFRSVTNINIDFCIMSYEKFVQFSRNVCAVYCLFFTECIFTSKSLLVLPQTLVDNLYRNYFNIALYFFIYFN